MISASEMRETVLTEEDRVANEGVALIWLAILGQALVILARPEGHNCRSFPSGFANSANLIHSVRLNQPIQ